MKLVAVLAFLMVTPQAGAAAEPAAAKAERPKVALTFDDLPVHAALPPGLGRLDVAKSILTALREAKAPPTYGFINAKTADSPETSTFLKLWREAGHPLANHSFSHMDLDANPVAAFQEDVLANEPVLRELMGEKDWHWFRYPYLREGNALEKRRPVRAFLKERGYRIAQVTMDFSDWAYNDAFARCVAQGDTKSVAWMEESYLKAAAESLERGVAGARQIYDREIKHVMLLHVGAFQTVMLPRLLSLLKERGFEIITLEEAQGDPIYEIDPDLPFEGGATLLDQMATRKGIPQTTPREYPVEKTAALCR